MQPKKRYQKYTSETNCYVDGCDNPAEYEVYLYDFYEYVDGGKEFFEQDYTCPFLCRKHMQENESKAKGERRPRGFVIYPFSNRDSAQGYTKYAPVGEAFSLIVDCADDFQSTLIHTYQEVNAELIKYLTKHPEFLYELNPRKFEELIAEIFKDMGFSVDMTPPTRDGGRDIHAIRSDALGSSLYLIECKRYASSRKVGVEPVRSLYGVVQSERATTGIIVTTSSFTQDAIDFATPLQYQMSLRDFDELKKWLVNFKNMKKRANNSLQ